MLLSFVTCAGNAITTKKIGGLANTQIHALLMWCSWACALFGSYVIYTSKEMFGKAHLTSQHGQAGAIVMTMMMFSPLVGGLTVNPSTGWFRTNKVVRAAHKWGNRSILALGWITSIYGILHMLQLDKPADPNKIAVFAGLAKNELIGGAMIAPFVLLAPVLLL